MSGSIESADETPSDAPAEPTPPERRSWVSTHLLACADPAEGGPDGHVEHDRHPDGDRRQGR